MAARAGTLAQFTLPSAPVATPAGIVRDGPFLSAGVNLDGRTLFRIAGPAAVPAGGLPLDQRLADVQTDLDQLLAVSGSGATERTAYDPRTLRVRIEKHGGVPVLEVVDATHPEPLGVVSITGNDAKYAQLDPDALAAQWRDVLQSAVVRALDLRQPATERRAVHTVTRVGLALALLSLAAWVGLASLKRRIRDSELSLARRTPESDEPVEPAAEGDPADVAQRRRRFLATTLRLQKPERRLRLYHATYESVCWLLALAWFVAIAWAATLFPQSTPVVQTLLHGGFAVATTLLAAGLVNRGLDVAIERVAGVFGMRAFGNSEDRARAALRVPTISRALSGFKTVVLAFVTVLAVLGEVGLPLGSVVTIGGLAAVALSLAAQNFVRDFVNGSLVLVEDHYVVGDFVAIGASAGIVEHLSLRMVQIRDAGGDLITIPHSAVTTVVNRSRNWSRVDFRVPLDPAADAQKATDLVRRTIETLADDDEWKPAIVLPLEWIGIEALSRDWTILRASVRTAPLRQFALSREINARVHAAFAAEGIGYGAPIPGVP